MNPETGPATTRTTLLGGRVVCEQPAAGFRVAIDAVLLAAAVPAAAGQRALELGSGSGAAALCLAARVPGVAVLGLELQANLALLATRNTALSGLADRVAFVAGDLLDPPAEIASQTFDHVFANPPYMKSGTGQTPADPARARATIEGAARLADWIRVGLDRLAAGGTLTLVHRRDRLDDILAHSDGHGGVAVRPLEPMAGRPAKRVLVQVTKGVGTGVDRLAPLVLHEDGRKYTAAAESVLRDAQALI